ncbi:MAG: hypothetical protein K2X91_04820, partial [Thermoleophilia bacterium]|nr:hypothetical protein [Thermoleophilia bacterium]
MPRKPHPADAFNAGIVANATAWSAFTQAAGRIARHFHTEADARQAAQVMADGFRRPALVYAIDAQGRTAVAHTVQPNNPQQSKESTMSETTTKTYAKRFNAQRAARKLLGEAAQEGEAFRTFKVPNGEWDFETLTAQATPDAEPEADDLGIPGFLRREAEAEVVEAAPPATEPVEASDPEFAARVEAKREAKRQRGKKLAEARAASRSEPKAEAAP